MAFVRFQASRCWNIVDGRFITICGSRPVAQRGHPGRDAHAPASVLMTALVVASWLRADGHRYRYRRRGSSGRWRLMVIRGILSSTALHAARTPILYRRLVHVRDVDEQDFPPIRTQGRARHSIWRDRRFAWRDHHDRYRATPSGLFWFFTVENSGATP